MAPSSSASDADAATLRACSDSGAVLGTVASAAYRQPLLRLARSARRSGWPCLVAQTYAPILLDNNRSISAGRTHIRELSLPDPPLLPRPSWCNRQRHGWRRSHLHRTRMWRIVLAAGFDLLAVDLDWDFADIHGIPLRPPSSLLPALREARTESGEVPSVIAEADAHAGQARFFNVGLMFIRSNAATVALARRTELRSFAAWEQGVFNEELNWGSGEQQAAPQLACCWTGLGAGRSHARGKEPRVSEGVSECRLAAHLRKVDAVHNLGHERAGKELRLRTEGRDECREEQPRAPPPPASSPFVWGDAARWDALNSSRQVEISGSRAEAAAYGGWQSDAENALIIRSVGRCGRLENGCRCRTRPVSDDDGRVYGRVKWERMLAAKPGMRLHGEAFVRAIEAVRSGERRLWVQGGALRVQPPANGSVLLRDWVQIASHLAAEQSVHGDFAEY